MIAIVGSAYTMGALSNIYFMDNHDMTAFEYVSDVLEFGTNFIISQFILEVFSGILFDDVFVSVFLLSLVCTAISTINALLHTIGAAGGYDLYTVWKNRKDHFSDNSQFVNLNRVVIVMIMVLTVVYCYPMPNNIIAKATYVFMGMTATALLPTYFHAMYSKNPCRKAAMVSMGIGFAVYLFFALFVNSSTCVFFSICEWIIRQSVLFPDTVLASTDALMFTLPLSIAVMVLSLLYFRMTERRQAAEAVGTE